jgi:predicted ester cyclase
MGETKRAMERNVETWNLHDKARWTAEIADDCEIVGVGGFAGKGRDLKDTFFSMWNDAFPDNKITPTVMIEEGEYGVLEAMFEGTHTGVLNSPAGAIPPTNRRIKAPFVSINKVRGGKFTQFHVLFDQVELLTQLGLMPVPAARS